MDDLIERAVKEHLKNNTSLNKEKEHKLNKPKKVQSEKQVKKQSKEVTKLSEKKGKESKLKEYIEYVSELNSNIQRLISVLSEAVEKMKVDNTVQKQLNELNKMVKQCLDENQSIAAGVLKVVEMVKELKESEAKPRTPSPEEFPRLPPHMYGEPPKGMHEIEQSITPKTAPQFFPQTPPQDFEQFQDLKAREGRIPLDEMEQLKERMPGTAQQPAEEKPLPIPIPMHKAPPSEFRQFKEKVKKLF